MLFWQGCHCLTNQDTLAPEMEMSANSLRKRESGNTTRGFFPACRLGIFSRSCGCVSDVANFDIPVSPDRDRHFVQHGAFLLAGCWRAI